MPHSSQDHLDEPGLDEFHPKPEFDQARSRASAASRTILQAINTQNSRGLSHELKLNQMKEWIQDQLYSIKDKKR